MWEHGSNWCVLAVPLLSMPPLSVVKALARNSGLCLYRLDGLPPPLSHRFRHPLPAVALLTGIAEPHPTHSAAMPSAVANLCCVPLRPGQLLGHGCFDCTTRGLAGTPGSDRWGCRLRKVVQKLCYAIPHVLQLPTAVRWDADELLFFSDELGYNVRIDVPSFILKKKDNRS